MVPTESQRRGCCHDRELRRRAGSSSCANKRRRSQHPSALAATVVVAGAVCASVAMGLHIPQPPLLYAAYKLRALAPVHALEWPDLRAPTTGVTFNRGQFININDDDSVRAVGINYWRLADHHGFVGELGTDGIWNGKPVVEIVELPQKTPEQTDRVDVDRALKGGVVPSVTVKGAKLRLSPEAVARVEKAGTLAKDTVKLARDARPALKPTAAGQRKAVSAVRRLMQQLGESSTPFEFDNVRQQLEECLDEQSLQLGPKLRRLRDDVQQLVQLHERRIDVMREAQQA